MTVIILVALFLFAIFLGKSHPNDLNEYNQFSGLNLDEGCDSHNQGDCIYRQLIYRASFVLFMLYFLLAVGSAFSEKVNRSFWMLKFAFAFCVFFGLWWGSNSFFAGWSHFARFFSFFWLLVQAILLLDFAYDLHDIIMLKDSESEGSRKWQIFYLVLSAGFLACSFTGIGYLYADYSDCRLGAFFTSVCLFFGVATTIISMLNQVSKGLLTPCVMFAYSTFLAWYALLSSPDQDCNPDANTNEGENPGPHLFSLLYLRTSLFTAAKINLLCLFSFRRQRDCHDHHFLYHICHPPLLCREWHQGAQHLQPGGRGCHHGPDRHGHSRHGTLSQDGRGPGLRLCPNRLAGKLRGGQ